MEPRKTYQKVVWAAHILKTLTKSRSQPVLDEGMQAHSETAENEIATKPDENDSGSDHGNDSPSSDTDVVACEDDVQTAEPTLISPAEPTMHIRKTFLDNLAELLSPSHGPNLVTATVMCEKEDQVIISVARNNHLDERNDEAFFASLREFMLRFSLNGRVSTCFGSVIGLRI